LKPDFVNAHLNRGNLLLRLRRFTEAVTSYDNVLVINPQHIDALFSKGEALHGLARFTDAVP